MTLTEQKKAAKEFSEYWCNSGYEKGETQVFWINLLRTVFGVAEPEKYVEFEKTEKLKTTKYIDGYIPETKVLIEQKGSNIDLAKAYHQSDNVDLTPYEQAKRYADGMRQSQKPRYIIVSNFKTFEVYDQDLPTQQERDTPYVIELKNLENEFNRLSFLVKKENVHLNKEMEVSFQAGRIVGEIYDKLLKQYKNPESEKTLKSLNMLCVRLVFCLYAEDAGIFNTKSQFQDYISSFKTENIRQGLISLFKVLDTKIEERDEELEDKLADFPYVNGGLFSGEDLSIPQFSEELRDLLIRKASADFDWSGISPTIFGAVFESTLNPVTRRKGGMHYTSIENIHKVIDPLFMNDLNNEYETICGIKTEKTRLQKLKDFQIKLSNLKFLDPACGSGNFLTETYLSLRKLENKVIRDLGNFDLFVMDNVKVSIHQFYGIEINDFAVVVAKTAMWIAECQMLQETSSIVHGNCEFLPLKTYANIVEGNALTIDWESVVPKTELSFIMGNPPFVGARLMSDSQKSDVSSVWGNIKNIGNLDYVSCWYKKAADLMENTVLKAALVSTNSITQGEQVSIMWKPLLENGLNINFAYRTFRWDSEANIKAHVHCVIIGFSCQNSVAQPVETTKRIYTSDNTFVEVKNINAYLLDAPDIFIESRCKPLCNVPEIGIGNKPIDGGNYLFTEDEMKDFVNKEPKSEKLFKKWVGSDEFINRYFRYCLFVGKANPSELVKMPEVMKRIKAVEEFRLSSSSKPTQKLAETPTRFHVENFPESTYIIIPRVSSEKRQYIPIGFLTSDILTSDSAHIIPDATLYDFGILTSNVHNDWMRAVCGRLETRYRYSKEIVYNNFPWCNPTAEQKAKIEKTAQTILDARAKYPDSSLGEMYSNILLYPELNKAHKENDKAVMEAYGFSIEMTESEIVEKLFGLYEKLISK